jgi:hypothetical protein
VEYIDIGSENSCIENVSPSVEYIKENNNKISMKKLSNVVYIHTAYDCSMKQRISNVWMTKLCIKVYK